MAVSNTSSTSSTSEPHALTPIHHTATKAEWMDAIEQQRLERSTLNRLIINYLVTGQKERRRDEERETDVFLCRRIQRSGGEVRGRSGYLSESRRFEFLGRTSSHSRGDRMRKNRRSDQSDQQESAGTARSKSTVSVSSEGISPSFSLLFSLSFVRSATTSDRIDPFELHRRGVELRADPSGRVRGRRDEDAARTGEDDGSAGLRQTIGLSLWLPDASLSSTTSGERNQQCLVDLSERRIRIGSVDARANGHVHAGETRPEATALPETHRHLSRQTR